MLFGKAIKAHLIAPLVVATTFVLGGLVILWAERRTHTACIETIDDMRPLDALWVGLAQCLALVPGTSRSGATIIGAMLLGSSRKAVTEFSFFLSLPTWIGAGLDSLWKERALLAETDIALFGVGLVFSFLAAWVCVRWLLRFISSHTFVPFAWHRIAFGIIVRGTAFSGLVTSAD